MRPAGVGRGFSQGAGSGIMGQGLVGAGRGLVGLRLSLIDLGGACGSGYGFNSGAGIEGCQS